ncbi:sensor histidine kinase [Alicyclobacillus vulcanalis]|uniref:histidine kinase n=1 Tax=Alicyclobacillus vulcanalis TaxID=252246 RepID=A0A1N7K8E4_9BACL|nr:HAMP domain-containing sensor histidine kinase [Alicyclobacillus vulcanalis]SIS57850.1 Signal transduction histidine kinase [Alicyclobacillus vulcanalis]
MRWDRGARRRSIQGTMLIWSTLWCAVVLVVFTVMFMASYQAESLIGQKRIMELEMATLLGQGADKLAEETVTTTWDRYAAATDSVIRLTDAQGNVLFQIMGPVFTAPVVDDIASRVPMPALGPDFAKPHWSYPYAWRDANGFHRVLALTEGVRFENGGYGQLSIFTVLDPVRQAGLHMLTVFLVLDAAVIALFAVGMRVLIDRGFRPLSRLMAGIQQVEWRRAGRLTFTDLPPELMSLQESVNQMLDRIDVAMDEQRRFVADASHELRTPLAIIAGHANLLRRWGRDNARVWEPAVRNIVQEVGRLQRLVDELLALSNLDQVDELPVGGGMGQDEMDELFARLRDDALLLRPDLEMEVSVHLTRGGRVAIQPDRLRQVLVGLLDNAMRHTPEGGWIRLAVREEATTARITVADSGEGIPEDVLPHVFERFYRGEAARREGQGAGLGLAISKQVVERYGGTIYVLSAPGKGTTVVIVLPLVGARRDSGG